ncbi:hypothetical protein ASF26_19685 [Methylobacterium sp. Leaf93]|nr:hypothetical protein ASF26_19685 [Methylobacterium sp. Leaf93]
MAHNGLSKPLNLKGESAMTDASEKQEFSQDGQGQVTVAMIEAGVRVMAAWIDSDEPDIRVPVRQLLLEALAVRGASG